MPRFGGGAPKCALCEKSVYAAEERKALGKIWHKTCVKCTGCKKLIESGKETDHDGDLFCKNCYGKRFGPKGVGGGSTAGCLQTKEDGETTRK